VPPVGATLGDGPVDAALEPPEETAVEAPAVDGVPVEAPLATTFAGTPAAGRSGSVTSMYVAPTDRGLASTWIADFHFAPVCAAEPK
jgi:hypothetical protein